MEIRSDNECPVPQGILVIIGGKENKGQQPDKGAISQQNDRRLEILKAFIELIPVADPIVEVCTSGSAEGEESFQEYKKVFEGLGIHQINHLHHTTRKEVLQDDLTERIDNAGALFFAGGDQLLLTGLYGGTTFLNHLKNRYIKDRIVIGGTSAGAMALSTPMIYAGSHEVDEIGGEIKITTGLEFLKDVCIDTHFVERGRFVRMAQVIVTNPSCIGFGIEEDTALIVRNGLEGEVIGSGTIIVMDGFHIEDSNISEFGDNKAVSIHNLKVHILIRGEKYNIPQMNPPHK